MFSIISHSKMTDLCRIAMGPVQFPVNLHPSEALSFAPVMTLGGETQSLFPSPLTRACAPSAAARRATACKDVCCEE
jgi:hypothetical protein